MCSAQDEQDPGIRDEAMGDLQRFQELVFFDYNLGQEDIFAFPGPL